MHKKTNALVDAEHFERPVIYRGRVQHNQYFGVTQPLKYSLNQRKKSSRSVTVTSYWYQCIQHSVFRIHFWQL